jgi:hypothetical protein
MEGMSLMLRKKVPLPVVVCVWWGGSWFGRTSFVLSFEWRAYDVITSGQAFFGNFGEILLEILLFVYV